MEHCSRRLYHTLASSKFSTGFHILYVCTEHIDLRVTSVLRQSIMEFFKRHSGVFLMKLLPIKHGKDGNAVLVFCMIF